MEKKITEVLNILGIHKKIAIILALISIALIKASKLSIRSIADFINLPYQKQSKVNRIWRLINKSKLFKPEKVMKALFEIAIKLSKERLIAIDFTSLKGYEIKLFIASVITRGRTLPFYCKVLKKEDIDKMRWKSENEFIKKCIEEIMEIIQEEMKGEVVIIGDRQFGTKMFIKYFMEEGIKFILRVKKNLGMEIKIEGEVEVKKGEEMKRGKYKVKIEGEEYEAYIEEEGGEKLIIITNEKIGGGVRKGVREYLKRSRCEQMHRDIKSRLNLLFLNSKYFKEMGEEKIKRYVVIIMLSEIVGIWMGKIAEKKKGIVKRFKSKRDEKSLYQLGEVIIKQIDRFKDILRSFILSVSKFFPLSDYR